MTDNKSGKTLTLRKKTAPEAGSDAPEGGRKRAGARARQVAQLERQREQQRLAQPPAAPAALPETAPAGPARPSAQRHGTTEKMPRHAVAHRDAAQGDRPPAGRKQDKPRAQSRG